MMPMLNNSIYTRNKLETEITVVLSERVWDSIDDLNLSECEM